ncbi:MAG: hypothetical protein J7M13_06090 [Synergistetes bacterium]|nr:hypothetical protein [Synergistota bacterium]
MKKALFVLKPGESKRLIAKAVAKLPEVKRALEEGYIVINPGSTNAYVAEEILGKKVEKSRFLAGYIENGELKVLPKEERIPPIILYKGKEANESYDDVLSKLGKDDVIIKGANAIDFEGNVGIMLGNPVGGTIGKILGPVVSRGVNLIIPVGLEKLIPSVKLASSVLGIEELDYADGFKIGLMPVCYGKTITEIEAFFTLANVEAFLVSKGGLGDSQGAVSIAVWGENKDVDKAIEIVESLKE